MEFIRFQTIDLISCLKKDLPAQFSRIWISLIKVFFHLSQQIVLLRFQSADLIRPSTKMICLFNFSAFSKVGDWKIIVDISSTDGSNSVWSKADLWYSICFFFQQTFCLRDSEILDGSGSNWIYLCNVLSWLEFGDRAFQISDVEGRWSVFQTITTSKQILKVAFNICLKLKTSLLFKIKIAQLPAHMNIFPCTNWM